MPWTSDIHFSRQDFAWKQWTSDIQLIEVRDQNDYYANKIHGLNVITLIIKELN